MAGLLRQLRRVEAGEACAAGKARGAMRRNGKEPMRGIGTGRRDGCLFPLAEDENLWEVKAQAVQSRLAPRGWRKSSFTRRHARFDAALRDHFEGSTRTTSANTASVNLTRVALVLALAVVCVTRRNRPYRFVGSGNATSALKSRRKSTRNT